MKHHKPDTASCVVLYGTRFGCLEPRPPAEMEEFIQAVQTVLRLAEVFFIVPPEAAKRLRLPIWKHNSSAFDTIYRIGFYKFIYSQTTDPFITFSQFPFEVGAKHRLFDLKYQFRPPLPDSAYCAYTDKLRHPSMGI